MTHPRLGLACIFALVCAIGCALPTVARAGDIIVARDAGLSAAERADIRADARVELEGRLALPHTEVVRAPAGEEAAAVAALNADPDVRYAVADSPLHTAAAPGDPDFSRQWALDGNTFPHIDILKAWSIADGDGVTVAVVDQEIAVTHADLNDNIAPGGRDFPVPAGCAVTSPTGAQDHGTYVAGIVAAERENDVAIAGVAPRSKLLPLRAVNNCGEASIVSIADALSYAGEEDVPVVVAALGTMPGRLSAAEASSHNQLFADIFREYDDTLFVVPAGNEGNDNNELPVYPCSTVDPVHGDPANLVCVGATNKSDAPVCSFNVGTRDVDLFAPGVDIYSTVRAGTLGNIQAARGSSPAAAIVAGVAALVKAQAPTAGPAEVKAALTSGPTIPGLSTTSVNGVRVNAARALGVPRDLSNPGPGGTWSSCDVDHDGLDTNDDQCDLEFGPRSLNGCPDSDGDGLRDIADNCPAAANADQTDADADLIGNACDASPRGDDADGDGKPALDDRCPSAYGTLADGCPAPVNPRPTATPPGTPDETPGPSAAGVASVSVKVSKCPRGRSGCLKTAKVTIRLTRAATASLRFEQRVKRGRKQVWVRYTTRSMNASTSARSLTLKRLKRGSYRVIVTVADSRKTKSFKV